MPETLEQIGFTKQEKEQNAQLAKEIFNRYEKGKDYLNRFGYYEKIEQALRFYNGDQWKGLKTSGETPPSLNVIKPVTDYKIAIVAKNTMSINYTQTDYSDLAYKKEKIAHRLNRYAAGLWEELNMDTMLWQIVTDAALSGDCFVYYYMSEDNTIKMNLLNPSNLMFADEQETDIQSQRYILIAQRRSVADIRAEAKRNNVSEEIIELITGDDDFTTSSGEMAKAEVENEFDKCVCVTMLYKKDDVVHFTKCTRAAVFVPDTLIPNLRSYPIAQMSWNKKAGCIRSTGEVNALIPNQIEINKSLARLTFGIKQYAYPHIVYDSSAVNHENVEKLGLIGSSVGLTNTKMQRVEDIISYLKPAGISPAASQSLENLINLTRELSGASEGVTGQINPEKTSGAAIIAVRDNAALPLNTYVANQRKFGEDTARIWYDLWCAYCIESLKVGLYYDSITGLESPIKTDTTVTLQEQITASDLKTLKPMIKIDISAANPYSKYAHETALEKLFSAGYISFEEYVEALDDDCAAPKAKLKQIIDKRKVNNEYDLPR